MLLSKNHPCCQVNQTQVQLELPMNTQYQCNQICSRSYTTTEQQHTNITTTTSATSTTQGPEVQHKNIYGT